MNLNLTRAQLDWLDEVLINITCDICPRRKECPGKGAQVCDDVESVVALAAYEAALE